MRPYIAIIKDSFREAFASRVLWVLLGLITLLLAALAPLGIGLTPTIEFTWADIVGGPELAGKLTAAATAGENTPSHRLASRLDNASRGALARLADVRREGERDRSADRQRRGEFLRGMADLRAALNNLIADRQLYDAATWQGVSLPREAKDLITRPRDELSRDEAGRLNRLLIESTFPGHFRRRAAQSVSLTYLGWDASGPLPFSKDQVESFLKTWILPTMMSTIVGIIGIIAAIVVTSSIIPQMFDPSAVTLLLSKPINRSLLFIAKFVGGCAFILLNVAYLLVGLWLIAGVRFGIWNHGMLWCIPIFLFMFLIYYAVSALSGLIWKSAIVSVVMTVIFWFLCFATGSIKQVTQTLMLDQRRIVKLAEAEGSLLAVTEEGTVQVWDADRRDWQVVAEASDRGGVPTIDGPVYHARTGQMLFGQGFRNPFGFGGQRITLRLGRERDGWTLRDGPPLPADTATFLVESDGKVLAVAADDIYRLKGEPGPNAETIKVLGIRLPFGGGGEFQPALADSTLEFADPIAAAADPEEPRIAVVAASDVYLLTRGTDGKYVETARRTLPGDENDGAAVAIAGPLVLVAREDGRTWLLSSADLTVQRELALEKYTQPRFAAAAPDGSRMAVLFQNHALWLIDTATGAPRKAAVSGQGDISGFAFTNDRLLVADQVNRVSSYDLASLARDKVLRPTMTRSEMAYYYAILPIYTVFPKPGELDNTVHYALTGKRTTDLGMFQGAVAQRREDLHPWRPVINGLAFVAVMMLFSCLYIERHEF
jgi:hypothetical protein